jgi:3-deoxy-D-manno-octulosonate 8-phosphate phosphatase (KDO 8-P phosphatase)
MDFNNIKLVVSEIDGIITEHLVAFGEMNVVMFKQFYMKDFEAINLIKKDWGFTFLSSDANINLSLCKKRNIPFFFAEKSKREVYNQILQRYGLIPDNVLYVGSSYSDINCIQMSGVSMCPDDAVPQVKAMVDHIIPVYSGTGILCYVYELLNDFKLNKNREE